MSLISVNLQIKTFDRLISLTWQPSDDRCKHQSTFTYLLCTLLLSGLLQIADKFEKFEKHWATAQKMT